MNEHTSLIGIGIVLLCLGVAAASFSRGIQSERDLTDEPEPDPSTVASGFA